MGNLSNTRNSDTKSTRQKNCFDLKLFNQLQPDVAYLYPLKTSENIGFMMFSGHMDKQHRAVIGQTGLNRERVKNLIILFQKNKDQKLFFW